MKKSYLNFLALAVMFIAGSLAPPQVNPFAKAQREAKPEAPIELI
jgi:hypothetical protein